jgi:hypothetical protein
MSARTSRSRSTIACRASAVGLSRRLSGTLCVGLAIALLTFASGLLYARFGGEAYLLMAALCLVTLPICAGCVSPSEAMALWRLLPCLAGTM